MMGNKLDNFVSHATSTALGTFNRLDKQFKPDIALIGIPTGGNVDASIFVKPGNQRLACEEANNLSSICKLAKEAERAKLNSQSYYMLQKTIQRSIENYLNEEDPNSSHAVYCSRPELLIDRPYVVAVILSLSKDALKVYSLPRAQSPHEPPIANSLPGAAILRYLDLCAEELTKLNSYSGERFFNYPAFEVIRDAGWFLMVSVVMHEADWRVGSHLFDFCNTLAGSRYERRAAAGRRMFIAHPNHEAIEQVVTFSTPVPLTEERAIRKLLELSSDETCLICDSRDVHGLGRRREVDFKDLFSVRFVERYIWELWQGNIVMMRVISGQPHMPKPVLSLEEFKEKMLCVFPDSNDDQILKLFGIVMKAAKQEHGALIVISNKDAAEAAAKRLQKQCTAIVPKQINHKDVDVLTAIDGAILIDTDSRCFAIGAILDGKASPKGSSSRGSRYNSALNYVEQYKQCLIVVISEDGSIDLVHADKAPIT